VEKAAPDKMLASEEIRIIITALGAGIDTDMDLARLRYHRVILMTDADVDGSHIRTLLLTFFFRHMTELINRGHLYIAQPPLYRVTAGKTHEWIHSDEQLDRFFAKRGLEGVRVYSTDGSLDITGMEIREFLKSLKELSQCSAELEKKEGVPVDATAILLMKYETPYRLDFQNKQEMQQLRAWFEEFQEEFQWRVVSDSSPKGENKLYISRGKGKSTIDKKLFDNPILHRCFALYPEVKKLVEGRKYIVIKKEKEIGKDVPWYKLASIIERLSDRSGVSIQRYKGLGEMTPEQLWETTMNPETRTLLGVTIADAAKADQIFQVLMGGDVPPRKAFIQAHALSVKNLDI